MKYIPDLRSIQCFTVVAREGNVTRAAERLHLTQPAVTQQLKRLSQASGLTLFTRTAKGLELTPDGAIMARKAEQVLAALMEFCQTAQDIAGQVRGRLRIGTILDPDSIRLGAFLKTLVWRSPALKTELTHGISGNVPERILGDELDAGYYLGNVNETLYGGNSGADHALTFHRLELMPFAYWVIAPPGWERRMAGRNWDELAHLPWIGTPPASAHHRLLRPIFMNLGLRQNVIAVVDQEPSMLAMVRSGVGLSLCRDSIALSERHAQGIVISDTVELNTTLEFICLKHRRQDPAIDTAFETLRQIWNC